MSASLPAHHRKRYLLPMQSNRSDEKSRNVKMHVTISTPNIWSRTALMLTALRGWRIVNHRETKQTRQLQHKKSANLRNSCCRWYQDRRLSEASHVRGSERRIWELGGIASQLRHCLALSAVPWHRIRYCFFYSKMRAFIDWKRRANRSKQRRGRINPTNPPQ